MADGDANHQTDMTTATEPAPALPDYVTSPNAVFGDEGVEWRYGKPPDYSKTRMFWEETKKMSHAAGSLPQLVENLVKNWEIEASFKPRLQDWRTIDHQNYTFAMNGGPPQGAEHMLKVGTYNAIIAPNEYYSPEHSDFAASHKTFKRMMPTFAWEVIEVYGVPPTVAFKWRHWGEMENDYVAFNAKGEKVIAKAHGGPIEIFGVTVATVDDKLRLQSIDTWMDPLDMFRQIAPSGVVNKESTNHKAQRDEAMHGSDGLKVDHEHSPPAGDGRRQDSTGALTQPITNSNGQTSNAFAPGFGVCPFIGHSTTSNELATNQTQPEVDPPGFLTPQPGVTEEQVLESVPFTAESLLPQSSFQMTGPGAARTDTKAKQVHVAVPALHSTEMGVDNPESIVQDEATAALGTKRPKLGSETQEVNHHASGMALDPVDATPQQPQAVSRSLYSSAVTGDVENVMNIAEAGDYVNVSFVAGSQDKFNQKLESSAHEEHSHPKTVEEAVMPDAGEAVAAPADSQETRQTYEEMSSITPAERETMMNQE